MVACTGLNYFFGQLQALAFEEEFKPEKMYDKTKPLLDGMHQVRRYSLDTHRHIR